MQNDPDLDPNGVPVVLLDFDGPLNALGPYPGRTTKRPRYNDIWGCQMSTGKARTAGRNWIVRWSPLLVQRLIRIHESGRAELRWCSTWNSDADSIERLLGLPELARAFDNTGKHVLDVPVMKRAAMQHVLEVEKRRAIWIDDMEVPFGWEPMHATLTAGGRALLIRPDGDLGLSPAHMDRIEQYIGLVPAEQVQA